MRPRSPGGGANAASSLTSKITIGASKITIGVPPLAALPQAEMSSSTTAKYSRNSLSNRDWAAILNLLFLSSRSWTLPEPASVNVIAPSSARSSSEPMCDDSYTGRIRARIRPTAFGSSSRRRVRNAYCSTRAASLALPFARRIAAERR